MNSYSYQFFNNDFLEPHSAAILFEILGNNYIFKYILTWIID